VAGEGERGAAVATKSESQSESKTVPVRLGRDYVGLAVPARTTVLRPPTTGPVADAAAAVRNSLAAPLESAPLAKRIQETNPRSVVITISDITRPVPNELVVSALLETLNAAGVRDEQVTILIATGMHRSSTAAERVLLLGDDLLRRCRVVDHCADAAATLRRVVDDPPVSISRAYLEAEFRIVTGLIEPHFMAGFSGGRKGICPGLADLATVERFHGYRVMGDPRADNGILDGNPCHEEALRIARIVGCDFLVNVSITQERQLAGVYSGHMEAAHLAGCSAVRKLTSFQIQDAYDLVITCGGGYPLDATYYQTVKGMVAALPATHEDSTLVVVSRCDEGIGSAEYTELMTRWGEDWRGFLDHISSSGVTTKDQWQMQMQTRATKKLAPDRIHLACDGLSVDRQRQMGVIPIAGAGPAMARCAAFAAQYDKQHPHSRIAVIPDGPYTMLEPPR
jgi:nickel-dependent lactate racemase